MSANKTQTESKTLGKRLLEVVWPIERHELKKFLPMSFMMLFIIFNFSFLRSLKDSLIVPSLGAEAVPYLKGFFVIPLTILFVIGYAKLVNRFDFKQVFVIITGSFILFFALFAFVLYPYQDFFHPSATTIAALAESMPRVKYLVLIFGKWTFALLYVAAELWGAAVLTLLFWQFANQTTKTSEAKRFYAMYGIIANVGLFCAGYIIKTIAVYARNHGANSVESAQIMIQFSTIILVVSGVLAIFVQRWIENNVLTDPRYATEDSSQPKKKKPKLSIKDSFKVIASSRYLLLIAVLVLGNGICINLVEGPWKKKVGQLYPTTEQYAMFMGDLAMITAVAVIILMIIGANITRRFSWFTAAIITPVIIAVTGMLFYALVITDNMGIDLNLISGAALAYTPLVLAVYVGFAQNVLSKAAKYSLFDATKEMAYIPLDVELKSKGKAAVDVIGGRMAKGGGAYIQSVLLSAFPGGYSDITPILAGIFLLINLGWLFAVGALSRRYASVLAEAESKKASS